MTEYHKIETLFERDKTTHKLKEPLVLKNPVYGILKEWQFTEKIDGTNIRIIWNPEAKEVLFRGRTDAADIHKDLLSYLASKFTVEIFEEAFLDAPVVIYGEGFGPGLQGGALYSPIKQFIGFDVSVGSKWWLSYKNVANICEKFDVPVVPLIGNMSLEEAVEYVRQGFKSFLWERKMEAEGLVGRPVEALFDKKGHRLIIKLRTKDFAVR